MNKKTISILIGVAVVAVLLGIWGFSIYHGNVPPPAPPTNNPPAPAAASAAPVIVKAVVSRSIDAQGRATGEATMFNAKTDKIVYAVLTLQNVLKTTKLSYVRYLNDKYVDSKVAQPSKDGATNFYFTFEKGIGAYPAGTYKLNFYVNGKRSISVTYTFK